jgi:hypothetical protein
MDGICVQPPPGISISKTPPEPFRSVFIGKVLKLDKGITMSAFIEPQYTAWHSGEGLPRQQIFAGVCFQFPVKK